MSTIKWSNLNAYNKVMTEYFKKLLEWNSGLTKLAKTVRSANSIEKVIQNMENDLHNNYPYGTQETSWLPLMRAARDTWNNIKKADTDQQAIRELIALYNDVIDKGCYEYIFKEIKTQLLKVASSLKITADEKKLLDGFLFPQRNKNTVSSAGVFAKPEIKQQQAGRVDPDVMKKVNARVDDIDARVTVLEKKVGISVRR